MEFYEAVSEKAERLNDLDADILRYVIASKEGVRDLTARSVADHFYVAPNTITRLAHKLGYKGFNDLKTSYLLSLREAGFIMERTSLDEQIVRTSDLLSDDLVDQVVEALDAARRVDFFASGLSALPCEGMSRRLTIMGKDSVVYTERHVMRHAAKRAEAPNVVFCVSVTGETKVSVEAAAIAKSHGATLVTLTGLSKNRLAAQADIALYAMDKHIAYDGMDLTSRLCFYYVMERIFERYFELRSMRAQDDAAEQAEKSEATA